MIQVVFGIVPGDIVGAVGQYRLGHVFDSGIAGNNGIKGTIALIAEG